MKLQTEELRIFLIYIIALCCVSCGTHEKNTAKVEPKPVVVGLDGRKFVEPTRTEAQQQVLENNLAEAKAKFDKDPSEENYIWYGRRVGYFLRLQEAVNIFTEGLTKYPDSYRLLRHRGHRYISLRQFDKAIADLQRAAELIAGKAPEIEPDGIPNKSGIPTGTTQFNIWYHLGLAYYLSSDYEAAAKVYQSCLAVSNNNDMLVATADWLYMTYQRLGNKEAAKALLNTITPDMNLVENDSYHRRLLLYKGIIPPDSVLSVAKDTEQYDLSIATQGYGVANWYYMQGDTLRAKKLLVETVRTPSFSAFGFIAAEVDLQRLFR